MIEEGKYKAMKKNILIVLLVLIGLIVLFHLFVSGRYVEQDTDFPDTFRIAGPVMSRRRSDGELDFRAFILMIPDFSAPIGRLRVITPFSDAYPHKSSELLYYDLFSRRVILSSLAYDYGAVETEYRRS